MILCFKQFINSLNKTKLYLIIANVFLVFSLILLNNLKIIPLGSTGDFIFFVVLTLAFALYRPGWAFLFLVGTIALENINLAPESLGFMIRPYQFIGGLVFLAVAIRFFSKRLYFQPVKLSWTDWLVFLIPLASLLHLFNLSDPKAGIKFALILFSFAILFLLAKNYIRTVADLKKILPFFFGSSLVIIFYGFWQNIRFAQGLNSFAVMPGRPNGTFTEPDWLGMYLVLILSGCYALVYFFSSRADSPLGTADCPRALKFIALFLFLASCFALLVLTVARSAWLAALGVTILFLLIIFTGLKLNFRKWRWKETVKIKIYIIAAFILSLTAVYFFHLTTFQLFNRVQSIGTGEQKITIACPGDIDAAIPKTIIDEKEYTRYNCRHINLEEIESEKTKGNIITEVYRKDPNVNARAEVYKKSWAEIKAHPILGIGWENIGAVLGRDGRGLNSSNIFLETWLGSGIIGFAGLVVILSNIFIQAIIGFCKETNTEQKTFALFVILSWTGIIIFNLFNAGIMLGFFWVWIGISTNYKFNLSSP